MSQGKQVGVAVLFAMLGVGGTLPAAAQSARPPIVAKVESLQLPAYVDRGGIKASIKAGWAIFAGDRVYTGPDGRLELTVAGDGRLKLAGNAEIVFNTGQTSATGADLPLFDVRRGTFHFTSPALTHPSAAGTLISLDSVAEVTVRGGQVVGREDFVCLLQGSATVTGSDQKVVPLIKPEHIVNIAMGGKVLAPIPVPQERLAAWLAQVQRVSGRPVLSASGQWDVSLNSGYNLKELEDMACRIQKRGFPAEIYPVREPGKQVWYRVVVRRFGTKSDAVEFLGTARSLGAKEPWVLLPQS